jgi:hypothetical protein
MSTLKSFWFQHYKAFRDRQDIELAPLTLLYGYNSAGKSAALRLLPGISRSSAESGDALYLNEDGPFGGADFQELIWAGQIQLDFGFTSGDATTSARWRLRCDPGTGAHWVDEFYLERAGRDTIDVRDQGGQAYEVGGAPTPELRFQALYPDLGEDLSALTDWCDAVTWVRGWRGEGSRDPRVPTSSPDELELTVETASRLLAYEHARRERALRDDIGSFYQALGYDLDLRPIVNGRTALTLGRRGAWPANLMDAGEGMIQVLPVLAALARAKLGHRPLVCVEQPELHLHPKAQRALADRFVEAARHPTPPTLLIETHSQHLMLCVQLAIVRQQLAPDRVRIYWVRQGDDGASTLERVELNEAGRDVAGNWPPDVFNDDSRLAREVIRARRERGLR